MSLEGDDEAEGEENETRTRAEMSRGRAIGGLGQEM